VLGWAVFVYATSGAPGVYGRVMFSMHMVMHMALMMAIPIFLVLAAPVTLALRALPARRDRTLGPREVVLAVVRSRWVTIIANPVVAAVIFFASLVGFYWTDAFEWALTTHSGHALMVAHFMLTGYAFVWSLIGTDPGPRKWPAPLRLVVLFGTLAAHAFFGLALMQGNWLLAPGFFKTIALPWVPDLIADQQLGGSIAWGVGELPTLVLALLVTRDWLRSDSREAVRSDRRAERDGDAELSAYNARLQQLARRGADRRSR
jgi:putative copper resistance protein D